MALIDELKLHLKAGDGGDGVARWLHEKGKEYGGPAGGDGGDGGDFYITAIRDIGLLSRYRQIKHFEAERGENGAGKSMHGRSGKEFVLPLPIGSVVTNLDTGRQFDLVEEDKRYLVLSGGRGGKGNVHFKSSTNVRPRQFTVGKPGEEADFQIELRLIADAGVIGLPNAGKTSLLNAITRASGKVGSYAFTTLEPNLGNFYGFILADIPGLIEGASKGKGLGHKFLRHIRRTRFILHCISLENKDPFGDYQVVRNELSLYDNSLADKEEVVVLTKTDLAEEQTAGKIKRFFERKFKKVLTVTVEDKESVKKFATDLVRFLSK